MKSSCIQHPAKEALIILRQWQIDFCNGNRCAASLLSFFEYWHNIKLAQSQKAKEANDTAEKHGDKRTQDEALIQFHTAKQLQEGIMGLYGEKTIREALKVLEQKNAVTITKNPNPRYAFDKTNHFRFQPDIITDWLFSRNGKSADSNGKSAARCGESAERTGENTRAIPETSSETTTENKGPVKTFSKDSLEMKIENYAIEQIQITHPHVKFKAAAKQKHCVVWNELMKLGRTKKEIGAVLKWLPTAKGNSNGWAGWAAQVQSPLQLLTKKEGNDVTKFDKLLSAMQAEERTPLKQGEFEPNYYSKD